MNVVGRFDPQFLAERNQALQVFLANALVKLPVTTSESMLNFLEVSYLCVCAPSTPTIRSTIINGAVITELRRALLNLTAITGGHSK